MNDKLAELRYSPTLDGRCFEAWLFKIMRTTSCASMGPDDEPRRSSNPLWCWLAAKVLHDLSLARGSRRRPLGSNETDDHPTEANQQIVVEARLWRRYPLTRTVRLRSFDGWRCRLLWFPLVDDAWVLRLESHVGLTGPHLLMLTHDFK